MTIKEDFADAALAAARAVGLTFALVLVGCGGATRDADDAATELEMNGAIPAELEPVANTARTDLARQLGIAPDTVEIVSAETMTWPDSALGCPEPDMMYMQVLSPGVRIVLRANGVEHHYHGAAGRAPFRCPDERREPARKAPRVD
ncbi:MAG: hypothetical protein RQ729_12450 [Wenzhouxiangellaceae bacterium]|nr:hypothetical protein [Wenzhouxiangellaceae bacterium]